MGSWDRILAKLKHMFLLSRSRHVVILRTSLYGVSVDTTSQVCSSVMLVLMILGNLKAQF
jgi:hypothetical protein